MKVLFTSFHMLYCLSQNSKYFLRYGRMTIAVWELSQGQSKGPAATRITCTVSMGTRNYVDQD